MNFIFEIRPYVTGGAKVLFTAFNFLTTFCILQYIKAAVCEPHLFEGSTEFLHLKFESQVVVGQLEHVRFSVRQ